MKLDSLESIISTILNGEIECGINKEYCFVVDEDGYLTFLKRNDALSPVQKDLDEHGELRDQFPLNESDGEVLWKSEYLGNIRGTEITEMFLNILGIDYL